MRTPRLAPALLSVVLLAGCGGPGPLQFFPNATLPPPETKVTPPPGPFNDKVTLTFTTDRPATVYVSVDGKDPRTTSAGRLSGESPFQVTLEKSATVKYFSSIAGKDETLKEGNWIRAGGPVGTISGVVVVGDFAVDKEVGVSRNGRIDSLGTPTMPGELPFTFDNLQTGTHRLFAISDRNDDGQLIPFIDFQSATVSIDLDLADPFKASAENVKLYLGASGTGLGTLSGTITLPEPPALQNLQVSVLSPDALTGGFDPMSLLGQLQNGYRIFTDPAQTGYPYVITDLPPGRIMPVASLLGFGGGGVALNLLANPLRTVNIEADKTSHYDFAFGPVDLSGNITIAAASAPQGIGYGVLAARSVSLTEGVQAVLMPVILTADPMTGDARSAYSGSCFKSNSTIALRVFTNVNGANPLVDSLTWVVNPLGGLPAHATITVGNTNTTQDVVVP